MSRHEKDLEDMHDLLQQMKDMHEEYNVPDHTEGFMTNLYRSAKKSYGTTFGKDTIKKITDMFNTKSEDEQKEALKDYIESTSNNNDVFSVFTSMISIVALMNILHDKDTTKERDDSALNSKKKNDPRVQQAKDHFHEFSVQQQKTDLKKILEQIYVEKKTAMMVLNGLLEMSNLQSEMKTKWKIQ
jgi:hypothetical protein